MGDQLAVFIDFENVALWAEREFFDFEITPLMEYLQSRGPAIVKRAYADWSRFARYRDEMMNNSIDTIQVYSVRQGKNRADIRLAVDALEIAVLRQQINTFVIVSGDSDFSPLVAKLREYGRYTIGIGPRSITHHLLVKSCDEFVYLETALGEPTDAGEHTPGDREAARSLLTKALQAYGQRGELPVLANRLRQTLLLMDPAFNEANFGYSQFKNWLEDNPDLVRMFVKDMHIYVAPLDYVAPATQDLLRNGIPEPARTTSLTSVPASSNSVTHVQSGLDYQYRQIFNRLRMTTVDVSTRRDFLRDIFRELSEHPGESTVDDLLDHLRERYEAQGMIRTKATLRDVLQMAFRQRGFDFHNRAVAADAPIWMAEEINDEATFILRAESDFVYAIVRAGLEIDLGELACVVVNDRTEVDYVQSLIDDLRQRGIIIRRGKRYMLPGRGVIPFENEPALQILCRDIDQVQIPENMQTGVEMAHNLAKKALMQRSQDFASSGNTYLLACRLQWDAVEKGEPGASLEDLRWFMASYASAMAGKLSQVNHDYSGARLYYLSFFALVQEDDPLWSRMRGLINPMLSYYWANAGRELDLNVSSWNISMSSPAQIAIFAANHPNPDLRKLWLNITVELAEVNPGLLRRIGHQIMMNRSEDPESMHVAEQIDNILSSLTTS